MPHKLSVGVVYDMAFNCVGRGCDQAGRVRAYWTGEMDLYGKLTLKPVDGSEPFYLFAEEITSRARLRTS